MSNKLQRTHSFSPKRFATSRCNSRMRSDASRLSSVRSVQPKYLVVLLRIDELEEYQLELFGIDELEEFRRGMEL
eukprot:9368803-Pyramimonas_sp.AAC.1